MKKRLSIHLNLLIILCADILLFSVSWYSAFSLRFNFNIPVNSMEIAVRLLPVIIIIKIIIFYYFNLYQGMWRYTSIRDLSNIIKASVASSLMIIFFIIFSRNFTGFSRSVFVIDSILTILFISSVRVGARLYFETINKKESEHTLINRLFQKKRIAATNLLIIGAGDSGEKIFREIRDNRNLKYNVVAFIDDNYVKQGKMIHGIPVMGTINELGFVADKRNVQEILIAVPSASSEQMRIMVDHCKESGIAFKTLPGMGELIDGRVTINAIRDVAYRDLLGREVVHIEGERIRECLENSCVLITGAGGSIGSDLCRQICRFKPEILILYEQAESPLYDIDLELKKNFPYIKIVPVLGDIRNKQRLYNVFNTRKPKIVFHAAAYKHVPMLEIQPWEAVLNNIGGTKNVIEISKKFQVERFVLVSTDKAVRPTSIMGATKRVAELLIQCQNGIATEVRNSTRFIAVRFGNVVGSVGSVVPLFKKQIAYGGPVTITHPEVTRYFMTIPEATRLILQACAMGKGYETFILKMGTPVKIADMAQDLIRLSGFEPDLDIKIEYIGLRPGEKLFEELITEGENIIPTDHKKIMVLSSTICDKMPLNENIDKIIKFAEKQDDQNIRRMLKKIVPEYTSDNKIS